MGSLAIDNLEETSFADKPMRGNVEFTYHSGDRPLDGYTIKRGIGFGGFGEVYYAVSDGGKEVALKLVQRHLDVELRGVSHCMNLKSGHLVAVFDVRKTARGENWIVMEYMSGASLQARMDQFRQGLPIDEAMHWLDGISRAIDDLHEAGIVHRDLKPGNVFSEANLVKVGDYGLSKFITHSRRSGQTQSVGTVHYMAPEISTGNYGRSVDVYSAAIMAFEMLCGEVPFDGETPGEILMKHLTSEPALEKLDPRFRGIFEKALAKNPLDRFQSARELFQAIAAIAATVAPNATGAVESAPAEAGSPGMQAFKSTPTPASRSTPAPRSVPNAKPAYDPRLDLTRSLPPPPGTFKAKRRAVSDTLWTMFMAGVMSIVLPVLAMTAEIVTSNGRNIDLATYASLAVLTGLSSWGTLAFAGLWEHQRADTSSRRFTMLLFGFGVGAVAMALNFWLDLQVPREVRVNYRLTNDFKELMPTLLVYLSAFGLSFAIPDWGSAACFSRTRRFSIGKVIWSFCVGVFLGKILGDVRALADPMWLGGIMAMTSATVQWVSPHKSRHLPPQLNPELLYA